VKPDVLLLEPLTPSVAEKLEAEYVVHRLFDAAARTHDAAALADRARAVVTGGGLGATNALIDALPNLGLIAINGIGTDAVDLGHARARGVRVTVTPDVLTDDVADLAVALLLAASRRLVVGDRYVREGGWARREAFPLARKVSGKRLGIVGMGRIGRAVARRAEAFGMTIAYADLRAIDGVPHRFEPDLRTLAAASDALVVAAAGGAGSRGIVDGPVLDALGPDGVLVNVARGSVVDEQALVAALAEGRIGAAGLDVFADEPHVPEALRAMDRVVLSPHRASATVETRSAMGELVLANLSAFFAGAELPTPVV
jgi:lactate dehydrogenase-like 2-hydroxyacid dehydrogenase